MISNPVHHGIQWHQDKWSDSKSSEDDYQNTHLQDAWGEKLTEKKDENTIRIYFQNLNGIKWDKDGGNWPAICQAMPISSGSQR